jgi:hypothetical protein
MIVVPTQNPLITAPFVDVDEAGYGEVPTEKQFELRVAHATVGTGTLVEQRNSTSQIVEAERVGETLDLLTSATGWTPGTSAAVSTAAQQPTGYSGNSLQVALTALAANGNSQSSVALVKDLSVYGGATIFRIYTRITSLTNVSSVRLWFSGPGWYAEYTATPSVINTWEEKTLTKGSPTATTGTVNWATVTQYGLRVYATAGGTVTSNVQARDLRIGTARTGKTTPDGHLAWESSYDFRVRYKDAAATYGTWSAWETMKVSQPPTVTASSPGAGASVTDPTPTFTITYSSPGSKAKTGGTLFLYEVVGGQDQLVDTFDIPGTDLSVTTPALLLSSGKTYAWIATATDTDGLVGSSTRRTFTTSFSQPSAPTGVTVTTDVDTSTALVSWSTALGANYEFRVYRRTSGGEVTRISANGETWREGDDPITASPLTDFHVPEGVTVEYLVSVHSGSASSEGESDTTSANGALVTDRWVNVVSERPDYTFEVRYVQPGASETPELQVEKTEAIGRSTLHVSVGELLEPELNLSIFIDREDRETIDKLRAISTDKTIPYSILKSPRGDVWRVQYGTVPRVFDEAGLTSTSISATVIAK